MSDLAISRVAGSTLSMPLLLAVTAIVLNLAISGNLLFVLGIPYSSPGGNIAMKLHPGSYCAALALGLAFWREGASACVRAAPAACIFLVFLLLCIVFQILTGGAGKIVIYLESFFPAGALAIVLARAEARMLRRLAWGLIGLFALNVVMAVAESFQQRQWIPVYLLDHELIANAREFRPTALYDHPLTGAAMTAIGFLLCLALPVVAWLRAGLLGLFGLGLLTFGGRAALVACCAVLAGVAAWEGQTRWRRGQLRLGHMVLIALALVAIALGLAALLTTTPIGARLAARFYWDESAKARDVQWRVLDMLDASEWLVGIARERLDLLVANLGRRYPFVAVENFWLLMFLNLGLLGFPLFLAGFFTFLGGVFARVPWPGKIMLVTLMAVASTSNSLGRKSDLLTVLIPAALATGGFRHVR